MAGYPTSADVTSLLGVATVTPGSADIAGALAAAIAEWEDRTGWKPFIKDGTDQTRYFDVPLFGSFGCALELEAGLLSLTSLTNGVALDGTGGTDLTLGSEFTLEPYQGGVDGKPWRRVLFAMSPIGNTELFQSTPQGFGARAIKIVGKWGYSSDCPADVKRVLIRRAAAEIVRDQQLGKAGFLSDVKQGPVEFAYDTAKGGMMYDRAMKEFADAAARYRRTGI